MTTEDILELLPIVAHRGWSVTKGGFIRDRNGFCPLCALANEVWGATYKHSPDSSWLQGGFYYPYEEAGPILCAADMRDHHLRYTLMRYLEM